MTNILSNATRREPHGRGPHAASHPDWDLRRDALIWAGEEPVAPNLVPFADEMRAWLQQKGKLSVVVQTPVDTPLRYTNPYTYSASTIGTGLGATISAAFNFSEGTDPIDPLEAEIERIRLHSELVMNIARFCEVTIKQLLYCSTVPRRMYQRATLGQLLALDCDDCRKAGRPTHDVSLLGALAHRYYECPALEHCVLDHLKIVGERRKVDAAHSSAQALNPRSAGASRADLRTLLDEAGHGLGHMADHIGTYERKLLAELNLVIFQWPSAPTLDQLSRIPVRIRLDDPLIPPRPSSAQEGSSQLDA